MGIGYVDSVIVYNRYVNGLMETEQYFGTRFDNVRVELTQGANRQCVRSENPEYQSSKAVQSPLCLEEADHGGNV